MSKILMYSTEVCPYCLAAERLLKNKGVAEITKIRVDLDPDRRMEMMKKTGRRTVPQIYIGNYYIGGYDELKTLEHAGKLDKMLTELKD